MWQVVAGSSVSTSLDFRLPPAELVIWKKLGSRNDLLSAQGRDGYTWQWELAVIQPERPSATATTIITRNPGPLEQLSSKQARTRAHNYSPIATLFSAAKN